MRRNNGDDDANEDGGDGGGVEPEAGGAQLCYAAPASVTKTTRVRPKRTHRRLLARRSTDSCVYGQGGSLTGRRRDSCSIFDPRLVIESVGWLAARAQVMICWNIALSSLSVEASEH